MTQPRSLQLQPQVYVSVPTRVQAMRWTAEPGVTEAFWDWCGEKFVERMKFTHKRGHDFVSAALYVDANQTWVPLEPGEWVLCDQHGFYPCKDDVFRKKYRPQNTTAGTPATFAEVQNTTTSHPETPTELQNE